MIETLITGIIGAVVGLAIVAGLGFLLLKAKPEALAKVVIFLSKLLREKAKLDPKVASKIENVLACIVIVFGAELLTIEDIDDDPKVKVIGQRIKTDSIELYDILNANYNKNKK